MSHDPEKYLYDMLDPATVWNVIEAKLPTLEKQLDTLLK